MNDKPQHVLCVLSDTQRAEYASEFKELERPGVLFAFHNSPEDAFDQIEKLKPVLVIFGMTIGPFEGLELLVLLLKRFPEFEEKVVVLPDKGDPFPIVVETRDHRTGQSNTEEIQFSQLAGLVRDATRSTTMFGLGVPEHLLDETDEQWQVKDSPESEPEPKSGPVAKLDEPAPAKVDKPATKPSADGDKPDTSYFQAGRKESVAPDTKRPRRPRPTTGPIRETRASAGAYRKSYPDPRVDPEPSAKPAPKATPAPTATATPKATATPAPASTPTPIAPAPSGPVPASHNLKLIAIGVAGGVVISLAMVLLLSGSDDKPTVDAAILAVAPEPTPAPPPTPVAERPDATATVPQPDAAASAADPPDAATATASVTHTELHSPVNLPISFAQGKSEYAVIDAIALDTLLKTFLRALRNDVSARLEIGGHTSDEGVPEFNQQLAGRRAIIVKLLLRRRRFPMARVFIKSYGATLIDPSDTTQMGNRRVTLRLTK